MERKEFEMRSKKQVIDELDRVEKEIEIKEHVLGEECQEAKDLQARLDVLIFAKSLFEKDNGYMNIENKSQLYELLGRHEFKKDKLEVLSPAWRDQNIRLWAIRWILEMNG